MENFKKLYVIVLFLWAVLLIARSAQYIFRIYDEFRNPPTTLAARLNPCEDKKLFDNYFEERLYKYLRLGKKC